MGEEERMEGREGGGERGGKEKEEKEGKSKKERRPFIELTMLSLARSFLARSSNQSGSIARVRISAGSPLPGSFVKTIAVEICRLPSYGKSDEQWGEKISRRQALGLE
ncbi:hypothetical protein HZH68_009722 [Vespula germanica]|uniref:Uncharacterized protein n=1 Tax=Vespula germanica TaxID=30212 RepID=A0A834N479_VESGE|nr:hypothetical protein HZH68_009722 [Vespula germanica]